MPRVKCDERMRAVIKELDEKGVPGVGTDVREECSDEWTAGYAIMLVDIEEPPDEMRDVYDEHAAVEKVIDVFVRHFGPSFTLVTESAKWKIVRGKRKRVSAVPRSAKQVLQVHRIGFWTLEIEAYRTSYRERERLLTARRRAEAKGLDDEGRMGAAMAGEG